MKYNTILSDKFSNIVYFIIGNREYDEYSYEEYYMISNHTDNEIIAAIEEFESKTNLSIKSLCWDFSEIESFEYDKLIEHGVLTKDNFDIENNLKNGKLVELDADLLVDIIGLCIKYIIKDFEWERLQINAKTIENLNGTCEGLFV